MGSGGFEWPAVAQAYAARVFAGLPSVEDLAREAVVRSRSSQVALRHLAHHRVEAPFGAEVVDRPVEVLPAMPRPVTVQWSSEDEARLERRRALRQIAAAGAGGVGPGSFDAGALRALVHAGLVVFDGRVARATPAGCQAALAA